jgi:hypothetical protein
MTNEERRVWLYKELSKRDILKNKKGNNASFEEYEKFYTNDNNVKLLYNNITSSKKISINDTKGKPLTLTSFYKEYVCDLQWAKDGGHCGTQPVDPNSPRQKNINNVYCTLDNGKITVGAFKDKTWQKFKDTYTITQQEEDAAKASCSNITPTPAPTGTTPSPTPTPNRSTTYVDTTATGQDIINGTLIKKGMKGDIVKKIQEHLNKHGASLKADGKFGPKTKAAVESFQSKKGLTIDGVVGPKTWLELVKDKSSTTTTTTPKPEEDDFKQEDIYGSEEDSFSFPSIIQTIDSAAYGD